MDLVFPIGYGIVFLLAWWRTAVHFAWMEATDWDQDGPDAEDKALGAMAGFMISMIWPVFLCLALVYFVFKALFRIDSLWAKPKPVGERVKDIRERKINRQRAEILASRSFVNEKEREFGWPLTVWDD